MRFSDTHRLILSKTEPLGDLGRVLRRVHIDSVLLGGLLLLAALGLIVLYSAVGSKMDLWLQQFFRLGVAIIGMVLVAQLPPDLIRRWTPWAYLFGLALLILVLLLGEVGQGAQRWLDLGIRFQPSEINP